MLPHNAVFGVVYELSVGKQGRSGSRGGSFGSDEPSPSKQRCSETKLMAFLGDRGVHPPIAMT